MAVFDVIEWFDETGEEMVHRFPESGSAETRLGSQLVVRENQAAIFFRDGKGLDHLGPGRHTLSTMNIPLLAQLLGLPFGGKSPFRVEVVFVNRKVFSNMKWGTKEPVVFRDGELGMVRLRAFGNYTMRIVQPLLFVNTLVGTRSAFSTAEIDGYLKNVVVSRFNDLLGETLDTVLNLPRLYDELAAALKSRVSDDFQRYGIELLDFFINSITPPEDVQKRIDERSGMGALGNLNQYMQFKTATAMGDIARGGGAGGAAGGAATEGMGLGVGAGLGMMMPGMIAGAMQQAKAGTPAPGAAAALTQCPHCQNPIPAGARFCLHCGKPLASPTTVCPSCKAEVPASGKFCSNCGAALAPAPAACAKCGTALVPGARFCVQCGAQVAG